jgi:hypothetical protein
MERIGEAVQRLHADATLIGGNRSASAKLTVSGLKILDAVVGYKEHRLALSLCNRMLGGWLTGDYSLHLARTRMMSPRELGREGHGPNLCD